MKSYVKLSLVYPNKWRWYAAPLLKDQPKLLEFNWFLCARPMKDEQGNYSIDVGRYASFFDNNTGKSYHVTFDATEKKPCLLLIFSDIRNKQKLSFLNTECHDDTTELSNDCKLRIDPDKALVETIKLGYCGAAMKVCTDGSCLSSSRCNIECNEVEFYFSRKVIEESKQCPYINFARSHAKYLKSVMGKKFFSTTFLEQAKPGEDSLKIKRLIEPYL